MLEIIFLVWFVRHLAKLARSKGRSGSWGALGVGLWFGGEVTGLVVGVLADAGAGAYLVALLFAAVGAIVAHFVVRSLRAAEGTVELAAALPGGGVFAPQGPPDLTNPYAPPRA